MGKSTSVILSVKRSLFKYGKFHIYATPSITFTRRNIINKRMIDSYRSVWNTVLRVINRYVRKHTTSPTHNCGVAINHDAEFVTDCTKINTYADLIETTLNKLKSNNFFKAFGMITKSNDQKKYYAFDLKIDAPNVSNITRLSSDKGDKIRNTSLFKYRRYGKVIYRPYHKRKCSRIVKQVKMPMSSKFISSVNSETSLNTGKKVIEEFSSIIYDNSQSITQFKSKNITETKSSDKDTEEINKKLNMLTSLEKMIKQRIAREMNQSYLNAEYNPSKVTTIIRNNFAVHSFIPNPISLLDLQENFLINPRNNKSIAYNSHKKGTNDTQYVERNNFNFDRCLHNSCVNLYPINNTLNLKRQISNFSGSQKLITQKKSVNATRFSSTITNKKFYPMPKSPLLDKYMFITDSQLPSNPSKIPDLPKLRYSESMLMTASNEKQFLSLMNNLKNKINYNDEMEKSRLNAIAKQLEQIRNLKKEFNLYSDEENFKTNHHYQPGEPKYELNCTPSKYVNASPARIISKIKEETKKQPIIPSTPTRKSFLRLPKTINDNIRASRLIQELNNIASRMFQASLKNMHSVTHINQDNVGNTRFGGVPPPKTVIEEYSKISPPAGLNNDNKLVSNNNFVFPRKSVQFVSKDKDRNHSKKSTPKPINEGTFINKVKPNENFINNLVSKNDPKIEGMQYEQFYKNHLSSFEDIQANISKSSNNRPNSTSELDPTNDMTSQKNTMSEFEPNVKSTSDFSAKNNPRLIKSVKNQNLRIPSNSKSTSQSKSTFIKSESSMKRQSQSLNNTVTKSLPQLWTNIFIKPQSSSNIQQSSKTYAKNKEEEKLSAPKINDLAINLQTNNKKQDVILRTIDKNRDATFQTSDKNKELKENNTMVESVIKGTTLTSNSEKNIGVEQTEKNKSPKNFVRRGDGTKPTVSYAINVNKTAMVKEHLEKYSKRRLNKLSDKKRKNSSSDNRKSVDVIKEPPTKNKKSSNEYKMNITITDSEKSSPVKLSQKTKSVNPSKQTQTMKTKVQKSASFIVSNAKRDKNIKLSSFNLSPTSKINLETSQKKLNTLNSETEKPLLGLSPHFLDLHNIEKNINNPHEEMLLNNKTIKINESKRLPIDDFESAFGYNTSKLTNKNQSNTHQFSVGSTSPYVTKVSSDISSSMYSPLITRKVNKVGAISVKSLHHNEPHHAMKKTYNRSSPLKTHVRQIMTDAGRLRGGEDRINYSLERLLIKAQSLTRNLQTIRSQCNEYVEKLEKYNFENNCPCDSIKCTCNGLNFNQNTNENHEFKSVSPRKHIPRSTLRKCDYEFQNHCMEGPFSDILTRHFLPGNKGKMPAIVGYKSDGIPIYGPPGAAYNVMGWTREGSPIFGRGGPGSKEPLVNIRGYYKSTPLYEPIDPAEKAKITLIGTYDNTPITGHKDLVNGMMFVGKGDKGFGKYKIITKTQRSLSTPNHMAITPTVSETPSIDSEEMKRALNSLISNEPAKQIQSIDHTDVKTSKSKPEKPKVYPLSYSIGNIRCNKYHKKCISSKYRSCSSKIYTPIRKCSTSTPSWRRNFRYNKINCPAIKREIQIKEEQWTHKPGEIMKPVARTIKMHRRRLGLQDPERLLKELEKKKK